MKRSYLAVLVAAAVALFDACHEKEYTVQLGDTTATESATVRPLTLENEVVLIPGTDMGVNLVLVRAGTFVMGNGEDDAPEHEVTLTHDYYIGRTEVTQRLYEAVMDTNPSQFNYGGDYPAENMDYNKAVAFCQRLSRLTGYRFELPTEAQWEYAAYGGQYGVRTDYAGSNVAGYVAWHRANAPEYYVSRADRVGQYDTIRHTKPVAQLQPNALGLYDMSGNVREWCADAWSSLAAEAATDPVCSTGSGLRVYRGGACNDSAQYCRVAHREAITPVSHGFSIGLRVVVRMD